MLEYKESDPLKVHHRRDQKRSAIPVPIQVSIIIGEKENRPTPLICSATTSDEAARSITVRKTPVLDASATRLTQSFVEK